MNCMEYSPVTFEFESAFYTGMSLHLSEINIEYLISKIFHAHAESFYIPQIFHFKIIISINILI